MAAPVRDSGCLDLEPVAGGEASKPYHLYAWRYLRDVGVV